mgnify:CR=1 FL=1
MKVLVTGANGFIGTHLCAYLAARDISCRRAVRRPDHQGGDTAVVPVSALTAHLEALGGAAGTVAHARTVASVAVSLMVSPAPRGFVRRRMVAARRMRSR